MFVSVATAVFELPTAVAGNEGVDKLALCAWPVPVKAMDVEPVPLWARVTVPLRAPVVDGVNVTLMAQVAFTAKEVQPGLVCVKSAAPEVTLTLVKVSVLVPVFVTTTLPAVTLSPTCFGENAMLPWDKLAMPCTPVEASEAVCVPAPVTTDTEPVRGVVAVGLNLTVVMQVPAGASVAGQFVATNEKSVPVTAEAVGTVTLRLPIPVLVSVAAAVLVPPTIVEGNAGADSVAEAA